jgi:glycosyltransferase involved in cell wall biosynthesis
LKYSRLRKLPVLWVYRALVSKKCVFHSTSELETAFIKEQFKQPVQIVEIPNYIELPRAVLREPQEYLLFIGRITPKKAIENLIEALSLSKKFRDSGLKLKIAGRGAAGYIKELKEIAIRYKLSEKIEFIGQVEGEQKQELYSNAFWTIMPSHTENFGMVVLESLAQSTPVSPQSIRHGRASKQQRLVFGQKIPRGIWQ